MALSDEDVDLLRAYGYTKAGTGNEWWRKDKHPNYIVRVNPTRGGGWRMSLAVRGSRGYHANVQTFIHPTLAAALVTYAMFGEIKPD